MGLPDKRIKSSQESNRQTGCSQQPARTVCGSGAGSHSSQLSSMTDLPWLTSGFSFPSYITGEMIVLPIRNGSAVFKDTVFSFSLLDCFAGSSSCHRVRGAKPPIRQDALEDILRQTYLGLKWGRGQPCFQSFSQWDPSSPGSSPLRDTL